MTKSQAALAIAPILGGKIGLIGHLNFIPKLITDFGYDMVAKNRQKLASGKCFLPDPEQKNKFIK